MQDRVGAVTANIARAEAGERLSGPDDGGWGEEDVVV